MSDLERLDRAVDEFVAALKAEVVRVLTPVVQRLEPHAERLAGHVPAWVFAVFAVVTPWRVVYLYAAVMLLVALAAGYEMWAAR